MTIHNEGIDAETRRLAKNLDFKRNTNEHKLPKQQLNEINEINEITKSTKSPNQRNQRNHQIIKSTKSPNHQINEINEIKIINGPEIMGKVESL